MAVRVRRVAGRSGVAVAALFVCTAAAAAVWPAHAAESLALPFAGGQAVRVVQGYNGGTHQGRSRYALDLVLASGDTSGAEVVSPIEGTVIWAFPPGTGNGCMAIGLRDGTYSIALCHVMFGRAFSRREAIARGQSLGTVGPPGTVGNNGTAHVHLELHRGGQANSPVPFAPPEGLALEGVALPASGAPNEQASRQPVVSTQAPGTAAPPPAQPPPRQSTTQTSQPRATAETPSPPAPASSALAAAAAPSARAAIVSGTDSCLKVRQKPSVDAAIVDCLPDGTDVPLTAAAERDEQYRWREVADRGWVVTEYLEVTRAVVNGTDSCLNVRESPTTRALVLGCLREGTFVGLTRESADGWRRIQPMPAVQDGGWVLAEYLD